MTGSFYNGVSGVKSSQFGVDVMGNNIANVNTTAFKSSRAEFSNIFGKMVPQTNPLYSNQAGQGSAKQTTALDLSNGLFVDTDSPFNLALADEGWFGVKGQFGDTFFTRAGEFNIDSAGNLVDKAGSIVLGSMGENIVGDQVSKINSIALNNVENQTPINLPKELYMPAVLTSNLSIKANLNPEIQTNYVDLPLEEDKIQHSYDPEKKIFTAQGDANNIKSAQKAKPGDKIYLHLRDKNGVKETISATIGEDLKWNLEYKNDKNLALDNVSIGGYARSIAQLESKRTFRAEVVLEDGKKHEINIHFEKILPQLDTSTKWNAKAEILGEDKKPLHVKEGVFTFDDKGRLLSHDLDEIQGIKLDFGSGYDGLTALAGITSSQANVITDGYIGGKLLNYTMGNDGEILANFDNDANTAVAKVAVYHFQNDQALNALGNSYFSQSSNSGKPIFYKDLQSGAFINGTQIQSNRLEMSNVSLATALTELIVLQKSFDANSKSITTSDQMIQNAINMKK